MKKIFFLLCLAMLSIASFSQQIPKGMKYQGVARDLKGVVLAEQKIVLRISLAGNNGRAWTPYYTESHSIETSQLGLFTLVVGEGTGTTGKFNEIPWSSDEIWMEVSIKDNSGFATISNSKLLAVPYAFHAMTANSIAGGGGNVLPGTTSDTTRTGIPSNTWTTFGNLGTTPGTDALGTADAADLMIITSNVERIRVLKEGNVEVKRSMAIGADLNVDSSVVLNKVHGSTINNGPFTVARTSPTLLSGTLVVDSATDLNADLNVDGPTDLNSNLNVNNGMPTKLTGTLQVDSVTNIKDSFYVAEGSPSTLTGTLRVDSNATFKQKIILDNAALDQDTASLIPSGALQVAGGVGIGGNLSVAGSARIGGGLSLNNLKVTGATQSENDTTGAVVVTGGVGIGKRLNVGGAATIGGPTTVNSSMTVNAGNGQMIINGGTSGNEGVSNNSPLIVNGKNQGIEVRLSEVDVPNRSNNFITFKDKGGTVRGRIEGQTANELTSDPQYAWDMTSLSANVAAATVQLVMAGLELSAAASDVRGCAGFGVVVCPPAWYVIVVKGIIFAARAAQVAVASKNLADYVQMKNASIGVAYSSSNGDYAEWLQKESPLMKFKPGQVVGITRGKISLTTEGAEKVLVISTNPIVLGNSPEDGREIYFEKVAFMGQVPVRVLGAVSAGDYILASAKNDGFAVAKNPADLIMEDLVNILGVAWTGSDNEKEKSINVAVGLTTKDIRLMVQSLDKKLIQQKEEVNTLRAQINTNNEMLARLVPGYKATPLKVDTKTAAVPAANSVSAIKMKPVSADENITAQQNIEAAVPKMQYQSTESKKIVQEMTQLWTAKVNNPEGSRLPAMTDDMIEKVLEMGIAYTATAEGTDGKSASAKLMSEIKSNPTLKKMIYSNIREGYTKALEEDKMVNKK